MLRENLVQGFKIVTADEQVTMFHMIVGDNLRNVLLHDIFQNSRDTATRYFHDILNVLTYFAKRSD